MNAFSCTFLRISTVTIRQTVSWLPSALCQPQTVVIIEVISKNQIPTEMDSRLIILTNAHCRVNVTFWAFWNTVPPIFHTLPIVTSLSVFNLTKHTPSSPPKWVRFSDPTSLDIDKYLTSYLCRIFGSENVTPCMGVYWDLLLLGYSIYLRLPIFTSLIGHYLSRLSSVSHFWLTSKYVQSLHFRSRLTVLFDCKPETFWLTNES